MRILVVEDERKVASFVRRALEAEQYAVDVGHDGETGLARARDEDYHLVILDVMLSRSAGRRRASASSCWSAPSAGRFVTVAAR